MRKIVVLTACLVLVTACGDSAGEGTTTSAPVTTTTAAAATTTTTTATTMPATTTTIDADLAERLAIAESLIGSYDGEWRNLTFGSTGAAEATIELSGTTATMTLMLGGNVFGVGSPDPVVFQFDLTEPPPYETTSGLFGNSTIDVEAGGSLTLVAQSIETLGGRSLIVEGSVTAQGFDLTYEISEPNGNRFAHGVVTMARV